MTETTGEQIDELKIVWLVEIERRTEVYSCICGRLAAAELLCICPSLNRRASPDDETKGKAIGEGETGNDIIVRRNDDLYNQGAEIT